VPPASPREIDTGTVELLCRVEARVARVVLNRPAAKNALTLPMKQALVKLLASLADDAEVGGVVLTGAGRDFCAGGDTKRMAREGAPPSPDERKRQLRWEHEIPLALHRMPKPTLAVLPGAAAVVGVEASSSSLSPHAATPAASASAGSTVAARRHLLRVIGRPLVRDPARRT
jgi:2-(1,2-epoxy-1,2-dihydrophenyl)acetyl-CoA isomerase